MMADWVLLQRPCGSVAAERSSLKQMRMAYMCGGAQWGWRVRQLVSTYILRVGAPAARRQGGVNVVDIMRIYMIRRGLCLAIE